MRSACSYCEASRRVSAAFYVLIVCPRTVETHTSAGPVTEPSSLGWIPVASFIVCMQHTAVMLKTCGVCTSVLTVNSCIVVE